MGLDGQHGVNGQYEPQPDAEASPITTISTDGDLILEYVVSSGTASSTSHKWRVASHLLASNSPYFQALLDPTKFSEGRNFNTQKQAWADNQAPKGVSQHALPTVTLPKVPPTSMCGEDAIELFLRILCLESVQETERTAFESGLRAQSPSLVARLIDLADSFNSPRIVRDLLWRVEYCYGKAKPGSLTKFNISLLSTREDRIRQIIFISTFLADTKVTGVMTHSLIVVGSRFWINGLEDPAEEDFRWKYLPNGLEGKFHNPHPGLYLYLTNAPNPQRKFTSDVSLF